MMKKRIPAILLTAAMLVTLLTGCMSMQTDIQFNKDGSGKVTLGMYFSDEFLEAMESDGTQILDPADGEILHKTIRGESYSGQEKSEFFLTVDELNESADDNGSEAAADSSTMHFTQTTKDGITYVTMDATLASDAEIAGDAANDAETAELVKACMNVTTSMSFPGGIKEVKGLDKSTYTISGRTITIDLVSGQKAQKYSVTGILTPTTASTGHGFTPIRTFTGGFVDVPADAWYKAALKTAYEAGVISGTSETTFNPQGSLTRAHVVVMAARLRSQYDGDKATFAKAFASDAWYQPYVDYAVKKGIISADDFKDFAPATTRAEMAYVFANCLPEEMYAVKHNIPAFSDVTAGGYTPAIDRLYQAGIINGTSATTFSPNNKLTRAQAAVFVGRLIDVSQRV